MKRRDFVSMLIGASTASIIVPKRVFSLPPQGFSTADMTVKNYFTSPYAWFLKTEQQNGLMLYDRRTFDDPFYAMTDDGLIELRIHARPA